MTSKTVLLCKKGACTTLATIARSACCPWSMYNMFTRVILNMISRTLEFRRGFSTIDHVHTITKLVEVSREYIQAAAVLRSST
ncbi:unnamed protein product [Heligmosomoides polygyrus]|uniref:Secreted protein n=1 Tax=Heligmosomoides polygyrus TaxID=6339 RepID=A0A183FEB4_HELPZ|nr:unnamed protein product [Heligmosomoides polygyrus]